MRRGTNGRWASEEPLDYLARRYEPELNTGCWLWSAGCCGTGYGAAGLPGYARLAHRASWQILVGPIPPNMVILHKCDTPVCINPDHLRLGTQADNMADCSRKGRVRSGSGRPPSTACPKGHPMAGENLFVGAGGKRLCRICRAERNRRSNGVRRAKRLAAQVEGDKSRDEQ